MFNVYCCGLTCRFYYLLYLLTVWLGSLCMSMSLLISPITIGVCRRKSTRLTAVIGGLVIALGCLFTSFANQFHQMYFSLGVMLGKICFYFTNRFGKMCFIYTIFTLISNKISEWGSLMCEANKVTVCCLYSLWFFK